MAEYGFLDNPWFQMGAGIMGASQPGVPGMTAIGQGILGGVQNLQRQRQLSDLAEQRRIQAQLQEFQMQQAQRQQAAQQAFGATLPEASRLQYEADPEAYMSSLYQKPSDFMLKWGLAGGDPTKYRETFGPAAPKITVGAQQRALPEQIQYDISSGIAEDVISGGREAGATLNWAEQGKEYLRNLKTGQWTPMAARAAAWLGVDPEFVGTEEAFTAHVGNEVMRRIQETKGSVSDAEMRYFRQISPQAAKTREGNFILFEIARRKAFRARDMRRYLPEYARKHKGDLGGFEAWYMKNHDPFPKFSVPQMMRQFRREILGTSIPAEREQQHRQGGWVE